MKAIEFLNQLKKLNTIIEYPALLFGDRQEGKQFQTYWYCVMIDPVGKTIKMGFRPDYTSDADLIDLIRQFEILCKRHSDFSVGFADVTDGICHDTFFEKSYFDPHNNAIELIFDQNGTDNLLDAICSGEFVEYATA